MARINLNSLGELKEQVVHINRVAKVVKGGKRFGFTALVTVGDGNGHVGIGKGKAREVSEAIRKANEDAKKSLKKYSVVDGKIPYMVMGKYGASEVVLRPAAAGTGVIAGNVVRSVLEVCGVTDILTKSLGSNNPHNLLKATIDGLAQLKQPAEILEERNRGKAGAAPEAKPQTPVEEHPAQAGSEEQPNQVPAEEPPVAV
ncbi:30S ribosomal protein S5 [candidate division TA06 bacterium]|uniref:Small ribosomal subunit protein uS5 n=1 Tax=candidate division TA06 bacterium TaxID=2250710 RepID=A0A933I7L8_UNCT6|nr:30S ribosomal protein S5 [candidate division TA06 bacterium]